MAIARELIVSPTKNEYLVKQSLIAIRNKRIEKILGTEMLEQIQLNNFPLDLVVDFCLGRTGRKSDGILANIIGYKFNAYIVERFKELNGVKNIRPEVDINTSIGNTSIDCLATFDGTQKFIRVSPSLKEESFNIKKGVNTFENKATRKIPRKAIVQIKKAKTIYPNANNVVICADTRAEREIVKSLDNIGANLIRSALSRNDIVKNILFMQRQIKSLY